jgi:hypothetical protein
VGTILISEQDTQGRFLASEIIDVIWLKYFASKRMRGIRDPDFIDEINREFVCLVCASIQHCLKAWRTGVYIKPPDFRYTNSPYCENMSPAPTVRRCGRLTVIDVYNRLIRTWMKIPDRLQPMLMEAIRNEIHKRLGIDEESGDVESDGGYDIEDIDEYHCMLESRVRANEEEVLPRTIRRLHAQRIPEDPPVSEDFPMNNDDVDDNGNRDDQGGGGDYQGGHGDNQGGDGDDDRSVYASFGNEPEE